VNAVDKFQLSVSCPGLASWTVSIQLLCCWYLEFHSFLYLLP